MKKFLLILSVLCLLAGITVFADTKKPADITINGTTFKLKYSNCSPSSKVCLNEYYKENEYDTKWSELFTVVYAKDITNFHDFTKAMLESQKYGNLIDNNEKYDIISFHIPYQTNEGEFTEQNVAKITDAKNKNGIISMQYAVRHKLSPQNQKELRYKMLNTTKNFKVVLLLMPPLDVYMSPLQDW